MIQPSYSLVLALIYALLTALGIGYNALVANMERKQYIEGFTSLAVAAGVGMTLLPFWFLGPVPIWQVYLAFVCTGTPMMVGSILRYVKARSEAQEDVRQGETLA